MLSLSSEQSGRSLQLPVPPLPSLAQRSQGRAARPFSLWCCWEGLPLLESSGLVVLHPCPIPGPALSRWPHIQKPRPLCLVNKPWAELHRATSQLTPRASSACPPTAGLLRPPPMRPRPRSSGSPSEMRDAMRCDVMPPLPQPAPLGLRYQQLLSPLRASSFCFFVFPPVFQLCPTSICIFRLLPAPSFTAQRWRLSWVPM